VVLSEEKIIRLVEERGVAASKYNNVAKEIIKYCQDFIWKNKFTGTTNFVLPNEITQKIDFVENLYLEITVTENVNGKFLSGGGKTTVKYTNEIVNGKLKNAKIFIYAYSYKHVLYTKTILTSLYHELNHVYDYYQDIINNWGFARRYANSAAKSKIDTADIQIDDYLKEILELIIYGLFSETELNALITSVYGSLQSCNSERKNFRHDIQESQAYCLYKKIKEILPDLFRAINNDNYHQINASLRKSGINIKPYHDGLLSFKKEFRKKINFRLNKLIKGIGSAASVYYDDKEIEPITDEITHVNPPMLLKHED